MLTRIEYPILYVSSIPVARKFYVNVLRFTATNGDDSFIELTLADTKLALNIADEPAKHAGHQTILLSSNDAAADYSRLSLLAPVVSPLIQAKYGKTFILADPDGNRIEVVE
jgi:predicted enzyme related to lactoylglutathione lyase